MTRRETDMAQQDIWRHEQEIAAATAAIVQHRMAIIKLKRRLSPVKQNDRSN